MKKLTLILVLGLLAVLLLPSTALAQTYDSGFQVQNLSSTDADIVITYYNKNGSVDATVNDTVPGDGSVTYFPIGASAGFDGSVVISSNQPVAAIANVLNGSDGSSYGAFSAGASVVSLPLINKNNFGIDTWFNVQNAGSADATVTVSYSGQSCDETQTIAPGAAYTFDQAINTCLPDGYVGAASINAGSGSVVATVMQVAPNGLFAYNGFTGGTANPVMPLTSSNVFSFQTGTQIQNTGGTASDVTVSYTPTGPGDGTACTETRTIPAGGSETFTLYAFTLTPPGGVAPSVTNCVFGEYFVGSMEVTGNSAGNDLVAIVNQTNFVDKGSAYNSFDPATATNTVVMPLIQDSFNIWTGYNVQNVSGSSTTVTCAYSDATAAQNDVATIGPGEAMNVVHLNAVANGELPDNLGGGLGYVGSAVCTADGSGLILGVVNQANSVASGDTTLTYEAFNN